MVEDGHKGAWFGDPELKERTVLRMKQHRADDEFVQRDYIVRDQAISSRWVEAGFTSGKPSASGWKGCAVGCLVSAEGFTGEEIEGIHSRVAEMFGLTYGLARAIDSMFEAQFGFEKAGDFAVAAVEAIPVGADLKDFDLAKSLGLLGHLAKFSTERDIERLTQEFLETLAAAPLVEPASD